jgi:glutamate-5-semialdehyde dehydrogenase
MLEQMGAAAKAASYKLALLSSREKNRVLEKIADYLESQSAEILRANEQDLAEARENGLSEAMLDRLALTPARLKGIADDRQVCNLADPVGQVIDGGLLDSGLRLERRRVPLGVIGVIYEARPNVTVDVASVPENRQRGYSARRKRDLAHQRRNGKSHPAGAGRVRLTGGCRAGD